MNIESYFEMLHKMEQKNKSRHAQQKDNDNDATTPPSSSDMHWR